MGVGCDRIVKIVVGTELEIKSIISSRIIQMPWMTFKVGAHYSAIERRRGSGPEESQIWEFVSEFEGMECRNVELIPGI